VLTCRKREGKDTDEKSGMGKPELERMWDEALRQVIRRYERSSDGLKGR
jgi:hypothetical protein